MVEVQLHSDFFKVLQYFFCCALAFPDFIIAAEAAG